MFKLRKKQEVINFLNNINKLELVTKSATG